MEVQITCKGCTITEDLQEYINERLAKLLTYDKAISNVSILLKKERRARKIQLIASSGPKQYIANTYSSEFIKSIRMAVDRMVTQIRKRSTQNNRS